MLFYSHSCDSLSFVIQVSCPLLFFASFASPVCDALRFNGFVFLRVLGALCGKDQFSVAA